VYKLILEMLQIRILIMLCAATHAIKLLPNGPIYECSNRYELRDILHKYIKELQNCSFVYEKFPICRENVTVAISIHEPYVINVSNGSATGILPGLLQIAMNMCCHGCSNINYVKSNETEKYFKEEASVIIPHEGAVESSHFLAYDFLPMLGVKGVTFLMKKSSREKIEVEKHLFESILGTWPLFITSIIMAIIAGCVVWVLDTWFNIEEFPSSFPRGPFEGFWWAFVSMTTVGYGDKAPKSIIARIFAIIWILAGITIFSMYTATLTSALSSEVDRTKIDSISGKDVGVLHTTAAGHDAAIQAHAHIKLYQSINDLMVALKNDDVYAIAVDDNIASYHLHALNKNIDDLVLHHRTPVSGNSYGILSYDKNFTIFIKTFLQSNKDSHAAMVEHVKINQSIFNRHAKKNEDHSDVLFSGESSFFYKTLFILLACGVITVLIGLTCKCFFKRNEVCLDHYIHMHNCTKRKKGNKDSESTPHGKNEELRQTNEDLQRQFITELEKFKEKWIDVLKRK